MAVTPPTRVSYTERSFASAGGGATASVSWNAGDLILVLTAHDGGTGNSPTGSGLSFSNVVTVAGAMRIDVATPSSGGSATITESTVANTELQGCAVWVLRGWSGLGVSFSQSHTTPLTVSATPQQVDSFFAWGVHDAIGGALNGSVPTPTATNVDEQLLEGGANYGLWVADITDRTSAAATNWGVTSGTTSTQLSIVGVEVKGINQAQTLVQQTTGSGTSLAFASGVGVGNLLVCSAHATSKPFSPAPHTDSQGNVWQVAGSANGSALVGVSQAVWFTYAKTSTAPTVTPVFTGGTVSEINLAEFSGVAPGMVVDAFAVASDPPTAGPVVLPSITTRSADDLLICYITPQTNTPTAWNSPWTAIRLLTVNSNTWGYRADVGPGSYTPNMSIPADGYVSLMLAFGTPVTTPRAQLPRRLGPKSVGPLYFAPLQSKAQPAVAAAPINLTANLTDAVGSVTANMTTPVQMTASLAGTGSVTANMTTPVKLTASPAGVGTVSAVMTPELISSSAGVGSVTANLTTPVLMSSSLASTGSVTANLTTPVLLTSSPAGVGSVSAALTVWLSSSFTGAGSVTAALTTPVLLTSSPAGTGTVTANLTTPVQMTASLAGTAAMTAFLVTGQFIGPNLPTTSANDTGTGSVAWTTIGNAFTSDNTYARAGLSTGQTSNWLLLQGFGFTLPANAVILGITIAVEHSTNAASGVVDAGIRLIKGGVIGSTDHADGSTVWPVATDNVATYGSDTDLWGDTWLGSDVNSSTFGIAISATNSGSNATARVDTATVSLHYYVPVDNHLFSAPSGVGSISAALTTPELTSAALAGSGTVSAALTTPVLMTSSLAGTGTVSAQLTTPVLMTSSLAGVGSVSAAMTTPVKLTSSLAGTGTVAAGLTVWLTASCAGTGSVTATLTTPVKLTASLAGVGSVTANLTTPVLLTCSTAGTGSVSSTMSVPGICFLTSSPAGTGSVTAALIVRPLLTSALSGAGSVSASLTTPVLMTSTSSATGTIAAALTTADQLVSSLVGTGTVTARLSATMSAAPAGQGAITATLTTPVRLSCATSGSGSVSATLRTPTQLFTNSTASGSVSATLTVMTSLHATVTAVGTIDAVMTVLAHQRTIEFPGILWDYDVGVDFVSSTVGVEWSYSVGVEWDDTVVDVGNLLPSQSGIE